MSWLDRLRNAFRPDAVSEDIEREMAFHLDSRAADLEKHGLTRTEARQEARRRFGRTDTHGESTRERDLVGWLESFVTDARYAVRGLRGAPGFTAVAILSLSLGIGANTAIFTMLNVAMVKTLPVANPEELVALAPTGVVNTMRGRAESFSPAGWQVIRDQQDIFSGVFAYGSTGSGDLSTGGEMRPIAVGLVTGGFFSTLGVQPAAGRLLSDADDVPGCAGGVVLTHSFWQSEFGGDPSAVGRMLRINGRPFEILGVADQRFIGLGYGYYPPVWAAQCAGPLIRGPMYSRGGLVVGRLKPGVTIEQARARLSSLAPAVAAAAPIELEGDRPFGIDAQPFARGLGFMRDEYGNGLLVLMGIVGVVLLISCANTANLLLARATARKREVAVRLALGAGAGRLVRQLLTESLILALASALVGMALAQIGTRLLVALLSRQGQPVMRELVPDENVLIFTTALAVLTALIFGLAPAWRAVRVKPESAMRVGGSGELEGHSRFGVAKGMVVAQIALSLVMLSGAGLLVERWRRTIAVELGFRPEGVVLVTVNTRAAAVPDSMRLALYTRVLERVRAVPGVQLASAAVRTPFGNAGWGAEIEVDGSRQTDRFVSLNEVSPGYFATIGTQLVAGRDFSDDLDKPGGPRVAIVNREVTRRFFSEGHPEPGTRAAGDEGSAVGRQFRISFGPGGTFTYQIVGIVDDTRDLRFTEQTEPIVYFALPRNPRPDAYMTFAARGNVSTSALATGVKTAIMDVDPRLTLRTRTLQSQLDESVRIPRTLGLLSATFGALALVLAMIGLYGIMAYNVARRRNEIGVRIALGADKSRIVRMVLADVSRITITGVVLGVLLALGAQRMLAAALTGIASNVAGNLGWSAAILALVAVAAASLPAWRASRQDPVTALRAD